MALQPLHSHGPRDRLVATVEVRGASLGVHRAIERLAAHDWLLVIYFSIKLCLVLTGRGDGRSVALAFAVGDLVWLGFVLWLARSVAKPGIVSSMLYRASLVALPLVSFLQLRAVLPVVTPRALDAEILAFDLKVFGVEPAIAWDRFVGPFTTEWFAFFYYSYFFVLGLHAIPIALAGEDGPTLRRFSLGILLVFCVGHLTWFVVPGYGPYSHVGNFANQLRGALWWPLVHDTVLAADAKRDIFPSLHTAAPVFITVFAFRHRSLPRFRWTWPVTAFFTLQIVISTMFLRWHYLADVVAGVILGVTADFVARRVVTWEQGRRARRGLPPVFPVGLSLWPRRHRATTPAQAVQGRRG